MLHQHLLNTPIGLSLSHSNTTVPQDTLSHTDITGTWSVKRIQHQQNGTGCYHTRQDDGVSSLSQIDLLN